MASKENRTQLHDTSVFTYTGHSVNSSRMAFQMQISEVIRQILKLYDYQMQKILVSHLQNSPKYCNDSSTHETQKYLWNPLNECFERYDALVNHPHKLSILQI